MFEKMDERKRKCILSRALELSKPGEIVHCDECDALCLKEELHRHDGSMYKQVLLCVECDLPPMWRSAYSRKRERRYFVFFNPRAHPMSYVQWSHPTAGNPLNAKYDAREDVLHKRKRVTS
jgi:hypothetical protein